MIDKNIVVVDNFYDQPNLVRKFALNCEYPTPQGHTYPGRNTTRDKDGIYYSEEIHSRVEAALGKKVVPQNPTTTGADCGYFRVSLAEDTFEQYIHVDPNSDWAGVLFLNTAEQCVPEAGTCFWRHKKLGLEHVPMNPAQGREIGYGDYEEIRTGLIYADGLDKSKWDRYCYVPMKYNRLVLFSPYLWHSHGDNFGDCINNGRLVQLFFYINA